MGVRLGSPPRFRCAACDRPAFSNVCRACRVKQYRVELAAWFKFESQRPASVGDARATGEGFLSVPVERGSGSAARPTQVLPVVRVPVADRTAPHGPDAREKEAADG
jgi:hypothetical protein